MKEKWKDVELKGHRYRVGKMNPQVGCWIAMQILTKMLPGFMEARLKAEGVNLANNRSQLSEDEFYNIQNHCLRVCSRYQQLGNAPEICQPLIREGGTWEFDDLKDEPLVVMGLTVHTMIFNLAPFFEGDALKELLGGTDLSSLSASKLTPSSSGPS